jgi:hypothetical protein
MLRGNNFFLLTISLVLTISFNYGIFTLLESVIPYLGLFIYTLIGIALLSFLQITRNILREPDLF